MSLPIDRRRLLKTTMRIGGAAAAAPFAAVAPVMAADQGVPGMLNLPARAIPVPRTLSPEAQQFLIAAAARPAGAGEPSFRDKAAWKAHIASLDHIFDPIIDRMLAGPAKVERTTIGGVSVCVGTPNVMRYPGRARLTIHGGGWSLLGGRYVMGDAAQTAAESGCITYSVDYRMLPDFPFPAGVEDCVAVYREIINRHDPKKIAISGESAGGNIAGAATLKIRDSGLPLPGAVGLMTPAADLLALGDTHQTNWGVDVVLRWPPDAPYASVVAYAGGHDLKDPYLSPLFGDFAKGFPPTYLQSGTRDLLLSDTVGMHRTLLAAGIEAELHVWEAMPHAGFGGTTPEDVEARRQFLKFIDKHLG